MISYRKALFLIHCCIGIAGCYASGAIAQEAKVDVCHIPPGNPENVHTITISENAVDTHLEHGDHLGACDPASTVSEQPLEVRESGNESGDTSACTCPRAGVWRVTNLDGWMECNVMGIKRKLKGAGKNDGAIWVLNEDCSSTFLEAYEKEREDVIMDRGRDCLFFGMAPGEEDGAAVLFDGAYKIESEEFITGEFYLDMSGHGMQCDGYRPFEIEYVEPIKEKDYDKLEQKMETYLEAARETRADHSELIEKYLEKTDGGKALGGRNGGE